MEKQKRQYPPFAWEYFREAETLLQELREEENEDRRQYLSQKIEECFDWAAFGGVSRDYIDFVRAQYIA